MRQFATIQLPIDERPTERIAVPFVATITNRYWASEARRMVRLGETREDFLVRLLMFYAGHNRPDGDTALVEAYGRAESAGAR